MRILGGGPIPTRIMVIAEAPTDADFATSQPLSGGAGSEFNRMLQEAGLMRSECYITYAWKTRLPGSSIRNIVTDVKKDITTRHVRLHDRWCLPEVVTSLRELEAEILLVQPQIIITLGTLPLWLLTGCWSADKWRGSQLMHGETKLIPTLNPALVLRQYDTRPLVVQDLRRAARHIYPGPYRNRPEWNFIVAPSYPQVQEVLTHLTESVRTAAEPVWLDFDIETKAGHIDCIGISWSRRDAICIPFMTTKNREGYWSLEEETQIIYALSQLLTHPNVRVRWQNGLYDAQYVYRHWHFIPRGGQDTMISQHSVFAAMPKGLDFLASMYADWYVYWKDEGKVASGADELTRWRYNLQDCVYTREVGEVLAQTVEHLGLGPVERRQQRLFWPVLSAMLRGVAVRKRAREAMAMEVQDALSVRESTLYQILGHSLNVNSPLQMQTLFYEDLKQPPVMKRVVAGGKVTMRPTCDDEALQRITAKEPLLRPITNAIADIRTLGKFHNDFILMPLDRDGRMRCSFNIAGDAAGKSAPYSYRLSSGKNAFGSGGNLQTIPSEKSKSSGKAAARGSLDFKLPNIRTMYCPDPGHTIFDMDLDRADLQVVVWESDDPMLKAALRMGADIHLLNTYAMDGRDPPPLEELVETHPKYPDHRGPRKHKREFAKVFCHATNYLGKARTVAAHTGRTIHEIDRAQKTWFGAHPGIEAWHDRVITQVKRHRFVENRFGYRWYIFDRVADDLMPQAVAWIPQSTVGGVINAIWQNLYDHVPEVEVLLQVHDSLVGQFLTSKTELVREKVREYSRIVVPYEDPLIIPAGMKTSTVSWGDCE